MKQEALKLFPYVDLTVIALILFFSVFVLMIFRTYSAKQRQVLQHAAQLPLGEQDEGGQHG